jgi:predicted secreted protein
MTPPRFPRLFLTAAVLMAFALPGAAQAQVVAAPSTEAAQRPTEMTLQASATSDVKQDTVDIAVAFDVTANEQAEAGKKLSAVLDEAMKVARSSKDVDASSGNFRVWSVVNAKAKTTTWRGQGEIILESKKFDAASALAAKLGEKGAIANLRFSLSRTGREAEERKLLNQAAAAFRERALAAATAFGFSGYRISRIELGGSGGAEPMYAMAKAARSPEGSPSTPLEPAMVSVSISVNGTVVLQ